MTIALDHFFILTDPGAPQAELLSGIGLIEGTPNDHPGQGTANRRFFCSDSMLELFYVRDANEAANSPGGRVLLARATDPSASPFGLIVRATTDSTEVPFPGWRYYPDYFEAGQYFHIGANSDLLDEPFCVCMPFDAPSSVSQPISAHPFTGINELRISVPVIRPSPILEAIAQVDRISLRLGQPHRMEIVFNEERERQSKDMRPELPLVIRW